MDTKGFMPPYCKLKWYIYSRQDSTFRKMWSASTDPKYAEHWPLHPTSPKQNQFHHIKKCTIYVKVSHICLHLSCNKAKKYPNLSRKWHNSWYIQKYVVWVGACKNHTRESICNTYTWWKQYFVRPNCADYTQIAMSRLTIISLNSDETWHAISSNRLLLITGGLPKHFSANVKHWKTIEISAESRYWMNCQGRLDGDLQDNCKWKSYDERRVYLAGRQRQNSQN